MGRLDTHQAKAMTSLRNRLVTETDGEEHVGARILTLDEIPEQIDMEIMLHMARGWQVRRYGTTVRFQKGDTIRWIWVRSREPLEDTL